MTSSKVDLVVFDMAGTTVYDGDAVHRCLAQALAGAGIQADRGEINVVMGIAKPLAIRAVLEAHSVDGNVVASETVERIHAAFRQQMQAHYEADPNVREMEGATEMFLRLRAEGVKVALDTGFDRATVQTLLRRLRWDAALLDATVSTDEVERGRPYSDMIFRAMQLTGIKDVARVAKVGDTPVDLQEGQAAGCGWIIGVTNGSHTRDELQSYPHTHLVTSIAEICGLLL